ncbi:MAG: regulatory protein RecX [Armatimonadota bacterium]
MDVITAIEPQKRRRNRRSIYVNGEFVAGVGEEVVVDLGLKAGQEVDGEKLAEVLRAEEVRSAREAALTLLDYRARTGKELERRLLQKGYPEDIVSRVVEQLGNIDFVNDERFAADWVASRITNRPIGRSQMKWELRRKGVAPELVEKALEQVDEDKEFDMALDLAVKKLGGKEIEDPESKRKLAGFLQRRGFHWEVVSRVIDRLLPED